MKNKLLLIGGIDSIGVPYTRDNKLNKSFLHIIEKYLTDNLNIDVNIIDMYAMNTYNKTDYLDKYLTNNISLFEIKNNLIDGIDKCRKANFIQFIKLPEKTKKLYTANENDKNIIIGTELKNNNSIFIYSCGTNDFLKEMNTNLRKLLNKKELDLKLKEINKPVTNVIDKIKNNLDKILEINYNTEIYVLGLYIPTKVSYIRKRVEGPIKVFNNSLKALCSEYKNVFYIDNSNLTKKEMGHADWHSNYKGQVLIGKNIIKVINEKSKIIEKI